MKNLKSSRLKKCVRTFLFIVAPLFVGACSHVAQLDRSKLNSEHMSLTQFPASYRSTPLTSLGGVSNRSAGAGCSVCAR